MIIPTRYLDKQQLEAIVLYLNAGHRCPDDKQWESKSICHFHSLTIYSTKLFFFFPPWADIVLGAEHMLMNKTEVISVSFLRVPNPVGKKELEKVIKIVLDTMGDSN